MLKTTMEIRLTEELTATLTIERGGQQAPKKGNNIIVVGKIKLPGEGSLAKEICFGYKVNILGESLCSRWGYRQEREISHDFKTYKKGFSATKKILLYEIKKLQDALKERAVALKEAEL